ncbi:hypothetical protein BZG13_13975 [Salinivibrio sp. ML323]|nr:hypothetical protein BZG13_13975 [Salinivibrio sp. ML323]
MLPGRLSRSAPILTPAPNLTSGLTFGFDVRWRRATGARPAWVFMIDIVLALMPTYPYFNVGGAIGDDDTRR